MREELTQRLEKFAYLCAFGAAASVLFSIAVSSILLTLAVAALLLSGAPLRFPPVKLPLGLFAAGTLISLALSEQPAAGRPQIRKFFVFLMLLALTSTLRTPSQARRLVLAMIALGALSAARGLGQFAWMMKNCGESYSCYVGERITGFMSHWMTFGGQIMLVLVLLTAFLFWAPPPKPPRWLLLASGGLMGAALLAGGTRSIWLATTVAASYLLWHWRRASLLALPLAAAVIIWAAPSYLQQRLQSLWKPQAEVDSNQHRIVSWRTGLRIIEAHPLFGVGPEHVRLRFADYVPPDVKRLPEGWYGHLHNIYLHFAAERGVPVLLALLWFLGRMLGDFVMAIRRAPFSLSDEKFLLHGAVASLVAILVGGVFEHNLGDSEVLILFLAVMSCGYIAVESVNRARDAGRA